MSIESHGENDPRFVNGRYIGEQALNRLDPDDEAALAEMEAGHDSERAESAGLTRMPTTFAEGMAELRRLRHQIEADLPPDSELTF